MSKQKKIVITTFYADGRAVWISEYPKQLTDEQIAGKVADVREMGYGIVDAFTDTTGRMVKVLPQAINSTESA